jgi:hypothetical protein
VIVPVYARRMRSHRLNRLALLTHGVALIGLGGADLGCSKEPVTEPIHINSPPEPTPAWDAAAINVNAPPISPDAAAKIEAGAKPDAGK